MTYNGPMTTLPKSFRVNLPSDDEVIASFVSSQSSGLALAVRMLIHDFVGRYGSTDALALLSNPSGRTMPPVTPTQTSDVSTSTSAPEPKKKAPQKTPSRVSKEPVEHSEEKPETTVEKPVLAPQPSVPEKTSTPTPNHELDILNVGVDDILGTAY